MQYFKHFASCTIIAVIMFACGWLVGAGRAVNMCIDHHPDLPQAEACVECKKDFNRVRDDFNKFMDDAADYFSNY